MARAEPPHRWWATGQTGRYYCGPQGPFGGRDGGKRQAHRVHSSTLQYIEQPPSDYQERG